MVVLLLATLALAPACGSFAAAPTPAGAAEPVVRRTVQKKVVVDVRGRRWQPAGKAFRGGVNRSATPDAASGSPALYRRARAGVRRIRLRVPRRGRYAVVLYLADPSPAPHRRVFHVDAEGKRARSNVVVYHGGNFDFVRREYGMRRPLHAIFESVVRNRRLNIRFRRVEGKPVVSAVEARRLGSVRMSSVEPLWRDDFNGPEGDRPNSDLWRYQTGFDWSHGELQAHTDRPENASLDGKGNLAITARRERYEMHGESDDYTSARMNAVRPISLRRAAIAGRVRHPAGAGLWSNFWFWGDESAAHPYPYNSELNVTEQNGATTRRVNSFFHFGEAVGEDRARDSQWLGGRGVRRRVSARFLTYGVRSVPGAFELSVNGKRHSSWTAADLPRRARWALDENPFTLILSLAVGGDYVDGAPPPSTRFPATMRIDYISVEG